MTNTIIEPIKF